MKVHPLIIAVLGLIGTVVGYYTGVKLTADQERISVSVEDVSVDLRNGNDLQIYIGDSALPDGWEFSRDADMQGHISRAGEGTKVDIVFSPKVTDRISAGFSPPPP